MPAPRWFVSPRFDLALIILTPIYSFLFLLAFYCAVTLSAHNSSTQENLVYLFFFIFTGLFDAPHIFQTFTRTHLDPSEYARRKIWHWIFPGLALCISIVCYWNNLNEEFLIFLGFYGTWHIVRQNIGFVRLYQHLNPKLNAGIDSLEVHLHHMGILVFYLFQTQALRELCSKHLWTTLKPFISSLQSISLFLFLGLFVFSIYKNFHILKLHKKWNSPKMYLIITNVLFLLILISLRVPPLILVAVSTLSHNVQYQAWISIYNTKKPNGLNLAVSSFLICLICGIIFVVAPESLSMYYNGFVLWHYFIDGKIWKLSNSAELKSLLSTHSI